MSKTEKDQPSGRIVVLASGGGTNCQALIDACASGVLQAEVVAVITNAVIAKLKGMKFRI